MAFLSGLAKDAGATAIEGAAKIVDDVQADLTQRLATLQALLGEHKIVITIEVQPKQP